MTSFIIIVQRIKVVLKYGTLESTSRGHPCPKEGRTRDDSGTGVENWCWKLDERVEDG